MSCSKEHKVYDETHSQDLRRDAIRLQLVRINIPLRHIDLLSFILRHRIVVRIGDAGIKMTNHLAGGPPAKLSSG